MEKFFSFFKNPDLFRNLLFGFIVGIFTFGSFPALYGAAIAYTCARLSGFLRGDASRCFDLTWVSTIAGAALGTSIYALVALLLCWIL